MALWWAVVSSEAPLGYLESINIRQKRRWGINRANISLVIYANVLTSVIKTPTNEGTWDNTHIANQI